MIAKTRNFVVSHIHREGNTCADKLAAYEILHPGVTWWGSIPSFIKEDFFRNRLGLPNYRFK